MQYEDFKQDAAMKLLALYGKKIPKAEAQEHIDIMNDTGKFADVKSLGDVYTCVQYYVKQTLKSESAPEPKNDLDDWFDKDNETAHEPAGKTEDKQPDTFSDPDKASTPITDFIFDIPLFEGFQSDARIHDESPVVTYPAGIGSVVMNGIKYSVTIREGGTWQQALNQLREWQLFWQEAAKYGIAPDNSCTTASSQKPLADLPAEMLGQTKPQFAQPPASKPLTQNQATQESDDNMIVRNIVAIRRVMKTYSATAKKAGEQYPVYIPTYIDDEGKPQQVGSFKFLYEGKKTWDELHKIVSEEVLHASEGALPVELPADMRFELHYTLIDATDGSGNTWSRFHFLEPYTDGEA